MQSRSSILAVIPVFYFSLLFHPAVGLAEDVNKLIAEEMLGRNESVTAPQGTFDIESSLIYQESDKSDLFGTDVSRVLSVPMTLRYAARKGLLIWATTPLQYSARETFLDNTTTNLITSGIGDISFGATYQLVQEGSSLPGVMFTLSGKADNGKTTDSTVTNNPTLGTGYWRAGGSVSITRTFEPLFTFVSMGYDHNFQKTKDGVVTKLGDAINLSPGVIFSVTNDMALRMQGDFSYISRSREDGSPTGAIATPAVLTFALGKSVGNWWYLEPGISHGLSKSAPDYALFINGVMRWH